MKRQKTLLALTMLAGITTAGSAHADYNTRQVWRDSEDQIVHNTYGNCVRGNWENSVDVCAPPPPPAVVTYVPPPPPRTIIAEADRTVYFPFNVASLTPELQQRLDLLAQRINSASDVQNAQVVGYADRIGTTSYNEMLSKKRAEGVRNYLIARGVVTANDTMTRWVGKTESNAQCPGKLTHQQLIECLAPDRKVTVELKYKVIEQTQPQTNAAPYPDGQYPVPQPSYPANPYVTGEVQPSAVAPLPAPQPEARSYPAGTLGTMPTAELTRMRAEQNDGAKPYMGQPPLPTTDARDASAQQQYAEQDQSSYPPQQSDEYMRRNLTTGE